MNTKFNMELSGRGRRTDHVFAASVLLLTALGLVTLYSSSYAFAQRFFGDGLYFISRQAVLGAAGLILFVIASLVDLELLRKLVKPLVLFSAILCVLTFVPAIGVNKNGAARWIGIGSYTYQPSELVKLVLPLYLAHIFDKKKEEIDILFRGVIPPAIITGIFCVLIFLQNNFSTAVFLALNALFMFYIAGVKFRYFFSAFFMIVPTAVLLVLRKEHRIRRFFSYVIPDFEPYGADYQINSSILSISSGRFWGRGIGQGVRKLSSVPEVHSDFIFSSYAEEAGFLGVIFFCLLFGVFAFRGYRSSMTNEKPFNRLLGCGLVTMIISQVLFNVAVVAGALPVTGVPLPFFSAGGSSLLTTLTMAGLVVNVSRFSENPDSLNRGEFAEAYMAGEALNGR